MAFYPKITGNTNTALNLNTFSNSDINVVTLTNSETQKTEQYCVLTIQSTGDAGTNVNISKISTISSEAEGSINSDSLLSETGNDFTKQRNSAYQSRLFTISPLEKQLVGGETTWVLENPFIGTVKENYSVENRYTKNWATTGNGNYNIPSATTLEADGAASYVVINGAGEMKPVNSYPDYDDIIEKGHTILPLYNHAYIIQNDIPTGHYAAIVIRASALQAFDVTRQHILEIKHNAQVEGQSSQIDYSINLNAGSINVFEPVAQYNSVTVAHGDSTVTRKRSMNFIPTNSVTGNSWRFDVNTISAGGGLTADNTTLPFFPDGTQYTQAVLDNVTNQIYTAFQNRDQDLIAGYSETFLSTIKLYDNSFVKQPFKASFTASNLFTPSVDFQESDIAAGDSFSHVIKTTDNYSQTGIVYTAENAQGVVSSIGPEKIKGLYTNFLEDAIKVTHQHQINIKVDDVIINTIDFSESSMIYPLFSYHSDFANKSGAVVNISNAESITTPADFVHVTDVVTQFEGLSNSITCVQRHPLYAWTFLSFSDGLTSHNVSINTLSTEDVLNHNGLLPAALRPDETSYVQTAAAVTQIKAATSETAVAGRAAANLATTVVPSVADGRKHYTVISDIPTPTYSASATAKERTAAGFYENQTVLGTKESTIDFHAPYASWQPGADAYGTERVPWFHLSNQYSLKTQYNEVRPLINLTHDTANAGVQMVPRLEFYGIPSLKTATNSSILDGPFDWSSGSRVFRQTSRVVLITANSDLLTHRVAADVDLASYVVGMEVFDLDGYFEGRNFIGEVVPHASNATIIKLVQEGADGQAGSTPSVSIAATDNQGITVTIGKPTQRVDFHRTSYTYNSALPSTEQRIRVHKTYGSDLSYQIPKIQAGQLKAQDSVIVENTILASEETAFEALFDEADVPQYSLATVTTEPTSELTQGITVVNFSPKEKGITFNGAEISSERYFNNDRNTDCYLGNQVGMYYHTIQLPVNGVYSHSMKFHLTNLGEEDVFFFSAKLEDPVYLPENAFMLKPHGSNTPTWTLGHNIVFAATLKDNATNPISTFTQIALPLEFKPSSTSIVSVGGAATNMLRPLNKFQGAYTESFPVNSFNKSGNDNNELIVSFTQTSNSSVAGDYYKCLEVLYVRDVGALQRYSKDGDIVERKYKDQGYWTMRKLIKITVTTSNQIKVTDVDSDEVLFNSSVDFNLTV
tara:strand:+ start:7827 stop:11441 length:3615 start_codon:yes stop_codon:yes gene_type:complete